ncbi:hypothetical protein [Caldivirga sp. UBA161]|uniref:hypothetical protein n=1 Tax=Caldivirga sp. UBA161 TaxID=1915569 RepID=UPI0025BF7FEF|nr:hypothetical protein [Caldivirga sp. UBA161]
MLKPNVLLAVVRVIETAMVVAVMYLYGINALTLPYIAIPMLMFVMAIIFALVKLIYVIVNIEPMLAQKIMLLTLAVDLLINIYLAYLSMVALGLTFIMMLYMLFFINISINLVLIALYAKTLR